MIETNFHFNDEVQIITGFYKGTLARVIRHKRDNTVNPYIDYYTLSVTGHTLHIEFTENDFIKLSEVQPVAGGGSTNIGGNP